MRALLFVCLFSIASSADNERSFAVEKAITQLDRGEYSQAIRILRANFEDRSSQHGSSSPVTLDAQLLLAMALVTAGHSSEGLQLSKRALDGIRQQNDPIALADAEVLYGMALRETGNTDESIRFLQRAIDRGITGIRLWRARNQLAISLCYKGRRKEAMKLAVLALASTPDSPRIQAHQTMTIAQLHLSLGQWSAAESTALRARQIAGDLWGPTHPEVAVLYGTLGAACLRLNRPVEAEEHLRKALAMSEVLFGPDHPEVSPVLRLLSDAVRKNGRKPEATEISKRSDEIRRRSGAVVPVWSLTKLQE